MTCCQLLLGLRRKHLTYEWSNKEVIFLDVKLIRTEEGIETDRFIKPTNPLLYLRYKSNHTKHVFKSIVYGQAVTVKTICSKEEFLEKQFENLKINSKRGVTQ